MFSFKEKVVWVTGSSTGIGREIALAFAENGANVIVHGNSSVKEAEITLKEVRDRGASALLVLGDVTNRNEVDRMAAEIIHKYKQIDVLVNNAGAMVKRSKIEDLDLETWTKIIDLNLTSVLHVTQSVLPFMKKQKKGSIINMTSIAARNGGGGGAVAYAAAKGAVSTLTRGLAKELVDSNIRVNGIAPGVISTPFHEKFTTAEMRKQTAAQVPLGREGTAKEIAGGALFLASDEASYIIGEILEINGGLLMD